MYEEFLNILESNNLTIDEICAAASVNEQDLINGDIKLNTFEKILHCTGRYKLQIVKEQ